MQELQNNIPVLFVLLMFFWVNPHGKIDVLRTLPLRKVQNRATSRYVYCLVREYIVPRRVCRMLGHTVVVRKWVCALS